MPTTKIASALVKGDVIVPGDDMPMQVDDVIIAGRSVTIFYFTGREHTTLNVSPGFEITILGSNETWCDGVGAHPPMVVRFTDIDPDDLSWCTMSCGCLWEDDPGDWE